MVGLVWHCLAESDCSHFPTQIPVLKEMVSLQPDTRTKTKCSPRRAHSDDRFLPIHTGSCSAVYRWVPYNDDALSSPGLFSVAVLTTQPRQVS